MNDRTKIAADLRHSADHPRDWICRLDPRLGVLHNTLYEMMRVTGCFENHKSANPPMLFHRLADIIDPTCHNKQIEINKMAPLESEQITSFVRTVARRSVLTQMASTRQ